MRIAVAWPRPRRDRWTLGLLKPDEYPDQSDALLYLDRREFRVEIEDSLGLPLNPLARMHEFYSGLDPLRAARALLRRHDAILSIGCSSALFLVQLRRAMGCRTPIVLIDPALSRDYPRRKRLQDIVLPRVEKVIVLGSVQLDYLREEYGDRVDAAMLLNRVDTRFYDPDAVEAPPDAGGPVVVSVGNDISRDFDTLVGAIRASGVVEQRGACCLIQSARPIAGPAPGIEQRPERISFVELRRLYRRADLFVLPLKDSIHAGGITSLLEAMAMARPVVVSGSRGILDYVADGETALVVEPGDVEGMAVAIRKLLDDPAERRRLGENARRFVVEHCSNERYAAALADLLRREVAGSPPPGPRPVPVPSTRN